MLCCNIWRKGLSICCSPPYSLADRALNSAGLARLEQSHCGVHRVPGGHTMATVSGCHPDHLCDVQLPATLLPVGTGPVHCCTSQGARTHPVQSCCGRTPTSWPILESMPRNKTPRPPHPHPILSFYHNQCYRGGHNPMRMVRKAYDPQGRQNLVSKQACCNLAGLYIVGYEQ